MKLNAEIVEGFATALLASRYDNPRPTPDFHRALWELCCTDEKYVALAAPRGHAKAQSLDSEVLTPDGWQRIGNLSVGDAIFNSYGCVSEVTNLHPISNMDLYRVTTRDGRSTLCNLDHLWNVRCDSNQKGVLQTKSLRQMLENWKSPRLDKRSGKEYTEYRYKLPTICPVPFSEKPLPLDPYTFGAWLGDGHSAGGRFTTADPEMLDYMPYKTEKQSGKYGYVIREVYPLLATLGCLKNPHRHGFKHIPEIYLLGSIDQRLNLLRGLMDSDGTIHQDGAIAYFCNKNEYIIDGTVSLIRSLGGIANKMENITSCNGKEFDSFLVSCKLPFNPFRLKRKADQWVGSKFEASFITGIEFETSALGRCISVKGDTYITDDYMATHNSTSITHAFTLASVLMGDKRFVMIVSDTEDQAFDFLGDIKNELLDNHELIKAFGIESLIRDTEGEIVCKFTHGKFRIIAKGSGQKVRGKKKDGARPDLIIGDDLENDEMVESELRRKKFRRWFFNALLPCGSDTCEIRIVGTILHDDSLLQRLIDSSAWKSVVFRAHKAINDYSDMLWPEKFNRERLEAIKSLYSEDGNIDGYSQEYLNEPITEGSEYFSKGDFLPIPTDVKGEPVFLRRELYAGVDFAISKSDQANNTAIVIGGMTDDRSLDVVDVRKGRWDGLQIIDELFAVQQRYGINLFFLEKGSIEKAIGPFAVEEMHKRGIYLNFHTMTPSQDKVLRARSIQGRMRGGGVRFDKGALWFHDFQSELIRFPRGKADDQVDAFAWLGIGLNEMMSALTDQEQEDEDWFDEFDQEDEGRSNTSGY